VCTTRPSGDQPPKGRQARLSTAVDNSVEGRSSTSPQEQCGQTTQNRKWSATVHTLLWTTVDEKLNPAENNHLSCDPPVKPGSAVHSPPEVEAWPPTAGPHDATQPQLPRRALSTSSTAPTTTTRHQTRRAAPSTAVPTARPRAFRYPARHAECTRVCGPPPHRQACGAQSPARASV